MLTDDEIAAMFDREPSDEPQQQSGGGIIDLGFIGDIAGAVPGIVSVFDKDLRQDQITLAQIQAQTAQAKAQAAAAKPESNKWIWIAAIVVVLIIAILIFMRSKSE